MNPDEQAEGQQGPAEEKPAPLASEQPPRRPPPRRPRFRGRRGGGGRDMRSAGPVREREPRRDDQSEQAPAAESIQAQAPGGIRKAIEEVEQVQSDLEKVLEDINEILRVLVQAEREKTASEREIDMLRESVRRLRGDRGGERSHYRPARSYPAERPPGAEPEEPYESRSGIRKEIEPGARILDAESRPEPEPSEPEKHDEPAEDDNPA